MHMNNIKFSKKPSDFIQLARNANKIFSGGKILTRSIFQLFPFQKKYIEIYICHSNIYITNNIYSGTYIYI